MSECFELVYHGGGGFSWSEVWNMPISHRRYNIKKIQEYLNKVENARNQQNQKITANTDMSKFKLPKHVLEESKKAAQSEKANKAYVTKSSRPKK